MWINVWKCVWVQSTYIPTYIKPLSIECVCVCDLFDLSLCFRSPNIYIFLFFNANFRCVHECNVRSAHHITYPSSSLSTIQLNIRTENIFMFIRYTFYVHTHTLYRDAYLFVNRGIKWLKSFFCFFGWPFSYLITNTSARATSYFFLLLLFHFTQFSVIFE